MRRAFYWMVWAACLLPLACAAYWFFTDQFTADPFKRTLQYMGEWGLRFLVIGLVLTPLRGITGWGWLMQYRRTIGLYGVFYVTLHLLAYVVLDQTFDWPAILKDLTKRPYIMIGMAAFVLLVPLAVTSTNGMIKRLGGRNWRRLHRLAYVIPILGAIHYALLVKLDETWPIFYGTLIAIVLALRVLPPRPFFQKRRKSLLF